MALNENSTLEEIVDEIDRLNNLIVDRGGGRIITPSTVNQVLEKGNYKGDITIKGDENLIPENIRLNTNIFGVGGTLSGYKTISANNYTLYSYATDCEVHSTLTAKTICETTLSINGGVRISSEVRTNSPSYPATLQIYINGVLVKSLSASNTAFSRYAYDYNGKVGDKIVLKLKHSHTTYGTSYSRNALITFGLQEL